MTAANFDENSPNTRCSAAPLDEAERGGVPERGAAAVAEQHLVAVGQREEVGEARHGRGPPPSGRRALAVAGAEVAGAGRGERRRALRRRTFDGPEPKRPSAGSSSGGRRMSVGVGHRPRLPGHLVARPSRFRAVAVPLRLGLPALLLGTSAAPSCGPTAPTRRPCQHARRARRGRAARRRCGRAPRSRCRTRTSRARTSRRCASRSGTRSNQCMIDAGRRASRRPRRARNAALSFWPGLNLPEADGRASLAPEPARVVAAPPVEAAEVARAAACRARPSTRDRAAGRAAASPRRRGGAHESRGARRASRSGPA